MSNDDWLPSTEKTPGISKSVHSFHPQPIRLYLAKDHDDAQMNPNFSYLATRHSSDDPIPVASAIPLCSSGQFIPRRNYTFVGGCSLNQSKSTDKIQENVQKVNINSTHSKCLPKSCNSGINNGNSSIDFSKDAQLYDEKVHQLDFNDDIDSITAFVDVYDLLVCLQICSPEVASTTGQMYCHFDNNPDDRPDRCVIITLKFNDICAVIQAHGHLDGCSQFVKVDLGIGDQAAAAAGEKERKRFSCVLTSTFPLRPTHSSQCIVSGRLCSISEFESAVQDYYNAGSKRKKTHKCQQGIDKGKPEADDNKESGKLKFLQGHILVSICSGDYHHARQSARLSATMTKTADGIISDFEKNLLLLDKKEKETKLVFLMAANGRKFAVEEDAIKSKSAHLAEMIEIHGQSITEGGRTCRMFHLENVTEETVTSLISYLRDFPLKEFGVTMISCKSAISLIELGRKYRIGNLETCICQLVVEEKDHLWFDVTSLVRLFKLCCERENGCEMDDEQIEKVKFKVLQAFQMKRAEDDKGGCVKRLFQEDPNTAADLLMGALSICSKHRPRF